MHTRHVGQLPSLRWLLTDVVVNVDTNSLQLCLFLARLMHSRIDRYTHCLSYVSSTSFGSIFLLFSSNMMWLQMLSDLAVRLKCCKFLLWISGLLFPVEVLVLCWPHDELVNMWGGLNQWYFSKLKLENPTSPQWTAVILHLNWHRNCWWTELGVLLLCSLK